MTDRPTPSTLAPEILDYYNRGAEASRLAHGVGPLERTRTIQLLRRYLPPPPAVIYDIGGGTGVYAFWLAAQGYQVQLLDATPLHIEQARARVQQESGSHPATMLVGDARSLPFADRSADAVLLFGPLYHLPERAERLAALSEANRILRPDGLLFTAAISRYASTFVGLLRNWVWHQTYMEMLEEEITHGRHLTPESWPNLFTTAYFHLPEELEAELEEVGLPAAAVVGVEGPGWMVPEFEDAWQMEERRAIILRIAALLEQEPVASPHMLSVSRKQR